MYLHLIYYSGDRSLVESIGKDASAGVRTKSWTVNNGTGRIRTCIPTNKG